MLGWNFPEQQKQGVQSTVHYFEQEAASLAQSATELQSGIAAINHADNASIARAQKALAGCRQDYKKIEFFLTYFFPSPAKIYNAPAEYEVEEPSLEFQEPMGLQQIESLLFQENPADHKKELLVQAEAVSASARDLRSLLYKFETNDAQILEALRIELIRVMALSITGYDAPQLKTGIKEAYQAVFSLQQVLKIYLKNKQPQHEKLKQQIEATLAYLALNEDFDTFDRLAFLTRFGLPLQKQLGLVIADLGLEINTNKFLNYKAEHLFSKTALNVKAFNGNDTVSEPLLLLGEKLFSEKALSGDNTRSCKSCHQPENYFADKLPQNFAMNGHAVLKRNTPGLLYSSLQHAQFWDGRSASLTDQIATVILDAEEMNGNDANVRQYLSGDKPYQVAFSKAFPGTEAKDITLKHIAKAISAYVGSLNPMNSAFDLYLQGNKQALNQDQINGFNIFTGKAKCATCHFMPLFNSLLPPDYSLTEYENIGITASDDFTQPIMDEDLGRYKQYPVKFYRNAFKTPTVRNAAQTAPYMHNGNFKDLKAVMDFYNNGGGHGLGLKNELQTLSAEPLNLTEKESDNIIQFIQALTDQLPNNNSTQLN